MGGRRLRSRGETLDEPARYKTASLAWTDRTLRVRTHPARATSLAESKADEDSWFGVHSMCRRSSCRWFSNSAHSSVRATHSYPMRPRTCASNMARTIRASQLEIVCVVYALASLTLRDVVEFLGSSLKTIKYGVNSRTDERAKGVRGRRT